MIALIFKNFTKEQKEIAHLLEDSCVVFDSIFEFEKRQVEFKSVYCPVPKELLKIKIRIPYFYDVSAKTCPDEMNYNSFTKFYSPLSGPSAVFISDKKLSKSASWWGLNSYWVNLAVDTDLIFNKKKFLTPKLHIGYIYENKESFELIKNLIFAKKANWVFHIYYPHEIDEFINNQAICYSGDLDRAKEEIFSNAHVFINFDLLLNNTSETFPSVLGAESMLKGCVLISSNSHGNNTNIIFDKYHYLKLDFLDSNTLIETLRYVDKRREKLEVMAQEGASVTRKYFGYKEIAQIKVKVLSRR